MISQTTEYVLRALIYLASHGNGKPILAKEIAEKVEIPKNYLSKLLYELKREGILVAERGKSGGYRLAKSADEIKIVDIVTLIDGADAYQGCFLRRVKCNEGDSCAAHGRWMPISNQIRNFLEKTTIKELAG